MLITLWITACSTDQSPPPTPVLIEAPEPVVVQLEAPPEPVVSTPPEGWTELVGAPSLDFAFDYHGTDNFTGAQLPGYEAKGAWLRDEAAAALLLAAADLDAQGLRLVVRDAYRPVRATLAMCDWAERTDQVHLLDDGYIARKSGHNHGNTIDVSLSRDGVALDFGSPYDHFGVESHTANASGEAAEARALLGGAMSKHGWKNSSKEWWHFSYSMPGTEPLDVPYGVSGD